MREITTATALADHAMHRATIEAILLPWLEIEAETLRKITPHYQQRISEIRKQSGKRIVNVKRTRLVDGKVKAADGAYRLELQAPQGRNPTVPAAEAWTIPGAPFGAEPFALTPPEAK